MSSSGDFNRSNEPPPSSSHDSSQTPPPHLQQAFPGSPPIVAWALPPKPGSFRPAGGGLVKPQSRTQPLNRTAPFSSLSAKGFVPTGVITSSSGKEHRSEATGGGDEDSDSTRDSQGGQNGYEQQEQAQQGEGTTMTAPQSTRSQSQDEPRRSQLRSRPNGKVQKDLSHLRLGGNNSPIPPPVYRTSLSPPLPAASSHAANPSQSTSSSSHSQQPLAHPLPSSIPSSSSSNYQPTPSTSSVNQLQSQKSSNQIPKKRAY